MKIWKILVLHKIRHFTWRACHDTLPSKTNLRGRQVVQDDKCEVCNVVVENSSHMF